MAFRKTTIKLALVFISFATGIAYAGSQRWEVSGGIGRTEFSGFGAFRDFGKSYQGIVGYRPLTWLVLELGYSTIEEMEGSPLPLELRKFSATPHYFRLKSHALRFGPALVWAPVQRLELFARVPFSFRTNQVLRFGDFSFTREWEQSRETRLSPVVGARMSLAEHINLGIAYETDRIWELRARTWEVQLTMHW